MTSLCRIKAHPTGAGLIDVLRRWSGGRARPSEASGIMHLDEVAINGFVGATFTAPEHLAFYAYGDGTVMGTTRITSAIRSHLASGGPGGVRALALVIYLGAGAAIVLVAASGLGGLGLHLNAFEIAIWLVLVVGTARGWKIAWTLLSGYTVLLALILSAAFANHGYEVARLLIILLLALQAGVLVSRPLRPAR